MLKRFLPFLLLASLADAQNYTIRTFAGGGPVIGQPAISYAIDQPVGVSGDAAGNLYVVVPASCQVWVFSTAGLTQVIGNGSCSFSGDGGPAAAASLNHPGGVAADSAGNVYIADTYNNAIRKVSGGIITTVAGTGTYGYNRDNGNATASELAHPSGVAVDAVGDIYIADTENCLIRRVNTIGTITTVVGNGTCGFNGDGGSPLFAALNAPFGVAVESTGSSIFIADTFNNRIRKVSSGIITTIVGNGTAGYSGDNGNPGSAQVAEPQGVAVDSSGNLYIADTGNSAIRLVSANMITTVPGSVKSPQGITVNGSNVYVADTLNNRIGKVAGGGITTVAGNGSAYAEGGATAGSEPNPMGSAVDSAGNLYFVDRIGCIARKVIAASGTISTIAGTGICGYNGEGNARSAQLNGPIAIAVDNSGNVFIADFYNHRVRMVSGTIISTVAGTGTSGYNGDNMSATAALLNYPQGVAVDSTGKNIYIADSDNLRIRKVSSGIITTVAGNGQAGYNGEGNPFSAELNYPAAVAVDSSGSLYIADTLNNRIRRVSGSPSQITTVAGSGAFGYNGDNVAGTLASLSEPFGLALDITGNLYIADSANHRIRKMSGGVISTLAGNGNPGFSGDNGVPTAAALNFPTGIVVDGTGNIYISDTGNNRIRVVNPSSCSYALTPTSASVAGAASSQIVSVAAPTGCAWTASTNETWLSITSGTSGSSNGTVAYSVQANPNAGVRTGYLTIAGTSFAVTQDSGCQVTLTPPSNSLGSSGTTNGSISVGLSGTSCQWTATSSVPWATINSGTSGVGNGTITYSVSSNASSIARSGAITVSTSATQAVFNIDESPSTCSYALPQSNQSFSSAGGPGTATVVASGNCSWTASPNVSWVAITSATSGTGNGSVRYLVQQNTTNISRSGTLTIAGQTYVVVQAGMSATGSNVNCAASVPSAPLVAGEGRTEIVGGLTLTCSGLPNPITADILLTLNNTTVTNKLTGTNTSDAMLVNGNVSQSGQMLGYTTVYWPGVMLNPVNGNAAVQINNVRADSTLLPGGTQLPSITGSLIVNSTTAVPVGNANQTLANAPTTLSFQVGQPNPAGGGPQTILPVIFQETTTTAFHVASGNTPGTRFRMVITGVPSTVQVYAPVYPAGGAAQAQLYSADCSGLGGSPITGTSMAGGTYTQLMPSGGITTATWVLLAADQGNIDTVTLPLLLLNAGATDLNQIKVVGSFAPVSPAGIACASNPNPDPAAAAVPRYRDPSAPVVPVNVRVTTSLMTTPTSSTRTSKVREDLSVAGRELGAIAELLAPRASTSNVGVTFMDTLTNESSSQILTRGSINGSLQSGNTLLTCAASGSGTCAMSGGQYSCTWGSVPATQSVTCSGDGQVDSSYTAGSSVSNSAGVNGDQTPADTTTVASSSSALVSPSGPTLQIENPQATTISGMVTVSGWAVEQLFAISSVQIQVDGNPAGSATYGGARQDVCNIYAGWVGCPNVGFTYALNTSSIKAGSHVLTALAIGADGQQTAFNVTVTVAASAVLPSVVIDQPSAGASVSGVITVSGWAIDNTTTVGTKISTVQVAVDGIVSGTATYGGARPDVCAAYTGRPVCPNVGYTYSLDTSKLPQGQHVITVSAQDSDSTPDTGSTSVTVSMPQSLSVSRLGIFRGPNSVLEDTVGANAYIAGTTKFIGSFFLSQGVVIALANGGNGVSTVYQPVTTDVPVAGDWTGDGHSKLGIYRPTTGQWFLDTNNDGSFDAGDTIYGYGGIAGDVPVVGDWLGTGKTCIGIFRGGFFWILDLNCNGAFDAADATFPFGGLTNDVPVTGNFGLPGEVGWRVGVVRSYAPGGVVGACSATTTVGCPFFWVIDGANTNAGSAATTHQPAAGSFAYGGLFGDVFVTGDWLGLGPSRAGLYRLGNWLEDLTGAHTYDTFFQFGGVATDKPLVGKW